MNSNSKFHKYCIVPRCGSTTIKTPNKLFIYVPHNEIIRRHWLKCAGLDSKEYSSDTQMYFCEDHFDLENDMENFRRYKLMGSVKTIRMNPNCVPSRFICLGGKKQNSKLFKLRRALVKKQRESMIKELQENMHYKNNEVRVSSCKGPKKKAIFINQPVHSTRNQAQKTEDSITPLPATRCIDLTSFKIFEEDKRVEKMNLRSTISKIINKPQLYIGLPKEHYFVIDLIQNRSRVSKENILLCLMRIKLNRTYSELADDFDCSVTEARHIFLTKLPQIVEVLSDFIEHPSSETVEKNLSITVVCIIDCLEIEIKKPKKVLTCTDYKKRNTIKYLIACTPDGYICFVSTGYAGRITYVNMVEHSKFLDSLQPGAYILANKGFKNVERYLSQKGFNLLRPASVTNGSNLSNSEMPQAKHIANLRIHANRIIYRLREFRMLKMHSVIKSNLIDILDSCVTTACTLINFRRTNEKNLPIDNK